MAIIPAEEKVFMVSNSTNTTYSGSAALKAMQQWYTMEDVTNTVRPYKVFTALLTQSGGDDTLYINGDEAIPLTIGVTYTIVDNTGLDVTNVGAPNNNIGTSFVATGTTPNSWGNIVDGWSILTYNTGAPVATVLENTIGNVWFTYIGTGNYLVNSDGLFITNKTYIDFGGFYGGENWISIYGNSSIIELVGSNDNILQNTPIEIRVYN